jgi:hypothetical protein
MADFIILNEISAVQIDSAAITIQGKLTEDAVKVACRYHQAVLMKPELDHLSLQSPQQNEELAEHNRIKSKMAF